MGRKVSDRFTVLFAGYIIASCTAEAMNLPGGRHRESIPFLR